jgi:hypothetical protein
LGALGFHKKSIRRSFLMFVVLLFCMPFCMIFWWVFLVLCDAEIHIWLLWLSLLAAMSHITKDGTLGLGRYFSSSILVF